MPTCKSCQQDFEPDDEDQEICDECEYAAYHSDLDDETGYDPSF